MLFQMLFAKDVLCFRTFWYNPFILTTSVRYSFNGLFIGLYIIINAYTYPFIYSFIPEKIFWGVFRVGSKLNINYCCLIAVSRATGDNCGLIYSSNGASGSGWYNGHGIKQWISVMNERKLFAPDTTRFHLSGKKTWNHVTELTHTCGSITPKFVDCWYNWIFAANNFACHFHINTLIWW